MPLREALKILEGEGRVTYVAHRGYFVAMLSLADLLEVHRMREILEAEAVSIANRRFHATLIDACTLPRMVRIIRQLRGAKEVYRAVYYTDEPNQDRVLHEHVPGPP